MPTCDTRVQMYYAMRLASALRSHVGQKASESSVIYRRDRSKSTLVLTVTVPTPPPPTPERMAQRSLISFKSPYTP